MISELIAVPSKMVPRVARKHVHCTWSCELAVLRTCAHSLLTLGREVARRPQRLPMQVHWFLSGSIDVGAEDEYPTVASSDLAYESNAQLVLGRVCKSSRMTRSIIQSVAPQCIFSTGITGQGSAERARGVQSRSAYSVCAASQYL